MSTEKTRFATYALVDLMGHQRLAGFVEEIEIAGAGFLHITVPDTKRAKGFSKIVGPKSIHSMTPLGSAEDALRIAETLQPAPLQAWELPSPSSRSDPREIPAIAGSGSTSEWSEFSGPGDDDDEEDEEDDDDDDDDYDEDDAEADDDLADILEEHADELGDDEDALDAKAGELETPDVTDCITFLGGHEQQSLQRLVEDNRCSPAKLSVAREVCRRLEHVAYEASYAAPEIRRSYISQHLRLGLPASHFTVDVVLWIQNEAGVVRPDTVAQDAADNAEISF